MLVNLFPDAAMNPRAYVSSQTLSFGHSVAQIDGIGWMKAALQRADQGTDSGTERALRIYDRL